MLKLRKILLCNFFYYSLFVLAILLTTIRIFLPRYSSYNEESTEFTGIITSIVAKDEYTTIYLKNHETVIASCNNSLLTDLDLHLGDTVTIYGVFQRPQKNTTKYLFNYQKYCYYKNIFYLVKIEKIEKLSTNKNLYYKVKQLIKNRLQDNPYLNAFLLGDKSYLSDEAKRSYQENGISHLFALSGMHISLLVKILEKLLKKIKALNNKIFPITSIFLISYLLLVGCSPSFLRGVLFYLLFSLNEIYSFFIDSKNLFLGILSLSLIFHPYDVFNLGFWYSYSISFALLSEAKYLNSKSYFLSLVKVSLLSFLISFPLNIYSFYEINLLSIFYNLLFVPFISFFLFPFSLITFFIKPLEPIYNFFAIHMEKVSLFLSQIKFGKFIFKRLPLFIYFLYFLILFLFFIYKKKKILISFLLLCIIHYMIPYFDSSEYIKMIDVGQGDALFIHSNQQNVLVDTGGLYEEGNLFFNVLSPLLKSLGISKIDYLFLTHGDKDHLGEAYTLLKNYRVGEVYLNQGKINFFEEKITKSHKKTFQIEEGKIIVVGDITFMELNKEFLDENDSSSVFLMIYQDRKVLLMGDASMESEKYILDTYDLGEIDILKVGHHGSKTSTSERLLKELKPKLALISCGKNNKFNHPNKETIVKLNRYHVPYLRTDQEGTITIYLNSGKVVTEGNS